MAKVSFALALTVLLLAGGPGTARATSAIVISEFHTRGVADGDYVELLNRTGAPATLTANWQLSNEIASGALGGTCALAGGAGQPALTL